MQNENIQEMPPNFDVDKYFSDKENLSASKDELFGIKKGSHRGQEIANSRMPNVPLRTSVGLEKRESIGSFGEFGLGVAQGAFQLVQGTANTFEELSGNDGPGTVSYAMDKWARKNQGSFIGAPKYRGVLDWSASMIGQQTPLMVSLIASGGTVGGLSRVLSLGVKGTKVAMKVGAMSTISSMTYGSNIDGIRKASKGRLSETEITLLGGVSTIFQAITEVAVGGEARITSAMAFNSIRKSSIPLATAVSAAKKRGLFAGAKGVAADAFFFEPGTEIIQSISQSGAEAFAAGPGVGITKEDLKQAFMEGLAAVPSSAVFGGISGYAEYRVRSKIIDTQRGIESDMETIRLRYDTDEQADAAVLATDEAFIAFKEELSDLLGRDGADAISDVMKEQAYHWAAETGKSPEEAIAEFNMLFSNTILTPQQIIQVRALKTPVDRVRWMRKNVQGYRSFESKQREVYRTDAINQQYDLELKRYRNLFGEDFANDLETSLNEDFIAETDKEGKKATTPEEQEQEAMANRTRALLRVYDLRQRAVDAVADLKLDNRETYRLLVTVTQQSASDMFRALYDPDENTEWITPERMRKTIGNLFYITNPDMSREDAFDLAEQLSSEEVEGEGSELQAAFMLEAALSESTGHYKRAELIQALRVLKKNDALWQSITSLERTEAQYRSLQDAAEEAGATISQRAQIALTHAHDMSYRGFTTISSIQGREGVVGSDGRADVNEIDVYTESLLDRIATLSADLREQMQTVQDTEEMSRLVDELNIAMDELDSRVIVVEEGLGKELEVSMGFDPGKEQVEGRQKGETLAETVDRLWASIDMSLDEIAQHSEELAVKREELRLLEESDIYLDMNKTWYAIQRRNKTLREYSAAKADAFADAKTELGDEFLNSDLEKIMADIELELMDEMIDAERNRQGLNGDKAKAKQQKLDTDVEFIKAAGLPREVHVFESGDGGEIYAHYDADKKLAIFYANATAEDVLHEWFHHVEISGLLPTSMQEAMDKKYGTSRNGKEMAARDFVFYLKKVADTGADKNVDTEYPEEMEATFAYLRAVFASGLHAGQGIPAGNGQESGSVAPESSIPETAENLQVAEEPKAQSPAPIALVNDLEGNALPVAENLNPSQDFQFSDDSKYSPQLREFFKGAFDNVTTEAHHKTAVKVLGTSLKDSPPDVGQHEQLLESAVADDVSDKKKLWRMAHIYKGEKGKDGKDGDAMIAFRVLVGKVLGIETPEHAKPLWDKMSLSQMREVANLSLEKQVSTGQYHTKEELDAMAQAVNPNAKSWSDLSKDEQRRIRTALNSLFRGKNDERLKDVAKSTKRKELERLAKLALRDFLPEAKTQARVNPEKRAKGVSGESVRRTDSLLQNGGRSFKRFDAWIQAKTNDFMAMMDYLDDGRENGAYKKLLSDPLRKIVQDWANARHETEAWLVEDGDRQGAHPAPQEWDKKYYFGDEKKILTLAEAVYIYMYTDKGRSKKETEALFGSNKDKLGNDPRSVIRDVITFVEGRGKTGYVRYVQQRGANDYKYSKTQKEGFVKTAPLRNWARAQMDYMRRIFPELDAAHFERTGSHLGNLFTDEKGKKHEFIAPSMRIGQNWAHGYGITDMFVVDENDRADLVRSLYSEEYGAEVTLDMLTYEERLDVFEQEEAAYSEERGIKRRRQDGRSKTVGATKKRSRGFVGAELLMDAPFIFGSYQDQADIYRTKYKTLDYLDNITRSDAFRVTLNATVGKDRVDIIHKAIREMIERERFVGGRDYVDNDYDRFVRHVQGRVMPAILGLRASSMAMQATSGPRILAEIPLRDSLKYLSNAAKVMAEVGSSGSKLVDAMMMRHNPLEGDTEVGRWFEHMRVSSPDIIRRMIGPDVQDFYASAQRRSGMAAMKVGRATLTEVQMGGFRVVDMATVLTAYHTSYESKVGELKRKSAGGGKRMSDAQIEKESTDFAEKVIGITQPASTITDRNLLQTSRPTVRMWFPFTGDRMKQFTYINRQIVAPLARGWRDGKFIGVLQAMTTRKYSSQPAGKRILFMGLLPMTIVSIIKRRRLPEDWEEWREDMLGLSVSVIPFIGPIFQNALTSNFEIDGTPIALMPIMASAKAMRSLKKDGLFDEDGYLNEYGTEQFARAVFSGQGLPIVGIDFVKELCKLMIKSDAIEPDDRTVLEKVLSAVSLEVAPAPDR